MEIIVNEINYLILAVLCFIYITDGKLKPLCMRFSITVLMFWAIFMCVFLFKKTLFTGDDFKLKMVHYEVVTNVILVFYLFSQVKNDNIFKIKRKKWQQ